MKSEPAVYSIADLEREPEEIWDGVRNYQARNFLRQMEVGDLAFFYHSNTKPPGIVGLMKIVEADIVDPTQFDESSSYYDAKSDPQAPRWRTVKVGYEETFATQITLDRLKATFTPDQLLVVKRGNRLSVMPVGEEVAMKLLDIGRRRSTS
jgi:predicted RNA-binding protein with PUA-like domain